MSELPPEEKRKRRQRRRYARFVASSLGGSGPDTIDNVLMEDGTRVLAEDGSTVILE